MTSKGLIVFALALIAAILFFTASLGWFPADLRDDLEPVAMGLCFAVVAWMCHIFIGGPELKG